MQFVSEERLVSWLDFVYTRIFFIEKGNRMRREGLNSSQVCAVYVRRHLGEIFNLDCHFVSPIPFSTFGIWN